MSNGPVVRLSTQPRILPQSTKMDLHFHCAFRFRRAQWLAHMLDSLVRVSRRVRWTAYFETTDCRRQSQRPTRAAVFPTPLPRQWSQKHHRKKPTYEPEGQASSYPTRRSLRMSGYNTFTEVKATFHKSQTRQFAGRGPTKRKVHLSRERITPAESWDLTTGIINHAKGWIPQSHFSSTSLPLSGFTYSWTLSSKFFSTFPRGTSSLSDSC